MSPRISFKKKSEYKRRIKQEEINQTNPGKTKDEIHQDVITALRATIPEEFIKKTLKIKATAPGTTSGMGSGGTGTTPPGMNPAPDPIGTVPGMNPAPDPIGTTAPGMNPEPIGTQPPGMNAEPIGTTAPGMVDRLQRTMIDNQRIRRLLDRMNAETNRPDTQTPEEASGEPIGTLAPPEDPIVDYSVETEDSTALTRAAARGGGGIVGGSGYYPAGGGDLSGIIPLIVLVTAAIIVLAAISNIL